MGQRKGTNPDPWFAKPSPPPNPPAWYAREVAKNQCNPCSRGDPVDCFGNHYVIEPIRNGSGVFVRHLGSCTTLKERSK